ncbi:MAG: diaminopimelate epimerase [Actinobacteria bacterium]|nr:diaminopimelate epimerase [Actinomycetota bacterium]MBU1942884.1 diaminopimelate epimerase [Actinomycetota bacterium]MBU2687616.1 diaminopimelate epimerase [Actinomycetota bacterium]
MEFFKYEATANDFLMLDGISSDVDLEPSDVPALCDRRRGVGADGVILMLPSESADMRMVIYNADGSEAEMCGNGIRALFRFGLDRGAVSSDSVTVQTAAGEKTVSHSASGGEGDLFTVGMGEPGLLRSEVPMLGEPSERAIGVPIELPDRTVEGTCISMGNPHCVLFVADTGDYPVETVGPLIERHALFPERTNVEFVTVEPPGLLHARVWERGVGETMACGTGACAALVSANLLGTAAKRATVCLPGGDLLVEWRDEGVFLTGPARFVFEGRIGR